MWKWFKKRDSETKNQETTVSKTEETQDPLYTIGFEEELRYKVAAKMDETDFGQPLSPEDVFGDSVSADEYVAFLNVTLIMMKYNRPTHIPEDSEVDSVIEDATTKEDVSAMMSLFYYYKQKGDNASAMKWLNTAVELEDGEAITRLGGAYKYGDGVEQSMSKAIKCYKQAIITSGYDDALLDLGLCYLHGEGVELDYEKGRYFMLRSAKQGNTPARYNMGWIYHYGAGVEINLDEALKWYTLSAMYGYDQAYTNLSSIYYNRKEFDKLLFWTDRFIRSGFPMAMYKMGCMYMDGEGVEKDEKKAFDLFKQAAEMDFPLAIVECSKCYFSGAGVEANTEIAQEYLLRAADLRLPQAEYVWAASYWDTDREKVEHYMYDAASQGYQQAIDFLREIQ